MSIRSTRIKPGSDLQGARHTEHAARTELAIFRHFVHECNLYWCNGIPCNFPIRAACEYEHARTCTRMEKPYVLRIRAPVSVLRVRPELCDP